MIPARQPLFRFEIVCRSGVLVFRNCPDFLQTVRLGLASRKAWRVRMPESTFRVHLYYPSGQRVGRGDIGAALTAIRGEK